MKYHNYFGSYISLKQSHHFEFVSVVDVVFAFKYLIFLWYKNILLIKLVYIPIMEIYPVELNGGVMKVGYFLNLRKVLIMMV